MLSDVCVFIIEHASKFFADATTTKDYIFLSLGAIGQLIFMSRFLVQWVESEKKKESVIPMTFWYLSIIGSLFVLSYGFYKHEPIIVMGQFGFFVYMRNIVLIRKKLKREAACLGGEDKSA